jgi:hypothetical protein
MSGLKNFLQFINDNWTTICVVIGLIVAVVEKTKEYIRLTNAEKIALAKKNITEEMLKLVTVAETNYAEWDKAGSIKRSEVISKIYKEYPILNKVLDQTALINWIDEEIDNSLKTLRSVIANNENKVTGTKN